MKVLLLVPGVPGLTGLSVLRAVKEERRRGKGGVTVQPQPRGLENVRGINIRRDSATLRLVMAKVRTVATAPYHNSDCCYQES